MNANRKLKPDGTYPGKASEITLDPEFAGLVPPPLPEEKALMDHALFTQGCRRPLVVWPVNGKKLLIVGYEVFATLRLYKLPFRVVEHSFPNREAALLYAIKDRLAHHNLSGLEVSYLRGLRYDAEKDPHGGDRRSDEFRAGQGAEEGCNGCPTSPDGMKTAQALGEIFQVSERTIRRDGMLARAVERLAALVGPEIKPRLLSRQSRLTRDAVLDLARLPQRRQKDLAMQLLLEGRLPRNWRTNGHGQTITVPRDAQAMAATLLRRLGRQWLEDFREVVLLDALTKPVQSDW